MSVRLTLLAFSALALTACDGDPMRIAARQTACCCDHCPTSAAPAASPAATARAEAPRQRPSGGALMYRVRAEPVIVTRTGGYDDRASEDGFSGGYGGRYGARGSTAAGMSVSIQESESSSERYSYRESSSGYAYGAASGGYAAGGGMATTGAPQQPYVRYKSASTTPGGWLEWPGKVED